MEVKLLKVLDRPDAIRTLISGSKFSDVVNLLDKVLESQAQNEQLCQLEALLVGISSHEQLLEIYEHIVDFLWSNELPADMHQIVSLFLNGCLDILEDWKTERLCYRLIKKLQYPCLVSTVLFDVLSKLLSKLESSSVVLTSMVDSLCAVEWHISNLDCLMNSLTTCLLQVKSKDRIIKKVLPSIFHLERESILPFVNKVLVFSSSKNLEFFLLTFESLMVSVSCEFSRFSAQELAGFLMFNIHSLVKTNEQFGEVILSTIKSSPKLCKSSEYYYTILLTLLSINQIQQQVSQLLTNSILTAFNNNQLISESAFLRSLCSLLDDPQCVMVNLSQRCTLSEWEFAVHGMVLLGFTLIRAASSYISFASGANAKVLRIAKVSSPFLTHDIVKLRILRSGLDMLLHIFKNCSSSRDEIVILIANLIWSESSHNTAIHAVDLLGDLVALCPYEVALRANYLDSIIDSIGLFPLGLSTALVHALLPLLRAGNLLECEGTTVCESECNPFGRIRVRLLSNLCKSATSPRIPNRRTAVACFILLLKHLKVSVSAFRSASQNSSIHSSLSQPAFGFSQSQATQKNPLVLYSQLQSTQVAQQAVLLPCDVSQNEVLCTEIITMLHRIIFSAFFRSQSGSLLSDPENIVKSDIYWGLCEVVLRNRGLCEPVLNLLLRLLTSCLSLAFLKNLRNINTRNTTRSSSPTVEKDSVYVACVPFDLNKLVECNVSGSEFKRNEHPDTLIWCLQLILTLPYFDSSWKRFRQASSNSESFDTSVSSSVSQLTQSNLSDSIQCGRTVTYSLFYKAVKLLLSISDALRLIPKEEFHLTGEMDLSNTPVGKLNRERAQLMLSIYDACLEFELKNPLERTQTVEDLKSQLISQTLPLSNWYRIRQLFARRIVLLNLLQTKATNPNSVAQQVGSLLGPASRFTTDSRTGQLIMSLISVSQANLKQILINSLKTDSYKQLANYLLQTILVRLNQFTHCAEGDIPCAYRDTLIDYITRILKQTVRFYHHNLTMENDTHLPATVNSDNVTQRETGANPESTMDLTKRNITTNSPSSTALAVINVGLTVTLDRLSAKRLYKLSNSLYSVTNAPSYPPTEFEQAIDDYEAVNDDESESLLLDVTPAQSLSALIKLIKGWTTKILNPLNAIPQQGSCSTSALSKDLVILLPLLVKLCRVRASLGMEAANAESNRRPSPYTGLDRVLAWLLRLMRSQSLHSNYGSDQSALVNIANSARVQLVNLALWLSHLVGPCQSTLDAHLRDDDNDLALDDILLNLTIDVTKILGTSSEYEDETPESAITYSIVNKSCLLSILSLIFASIKQLLMDYDWLLNCISINYGGRQLLHDSNTSTDSQFKIEGSHQEEALCLRLVGCGEILTQLFKTALPAPSVHVDTLLEIGTRVFNLLERFTKYYIRTMKSNYGSFPVIFERLVKVFGRDVSSTAYTFISYIQNCEAEKMRNFQDAKKPPQKGKSKETLKKSATSTRGLPHNVLSRSIKNSRLIPQFIYAVEQFERFLMQLSKVSKINLMRFVKLSMSRDFRINQATVAARLEHSTVLSQSTDEDNGVDDDIEVSTAVVGGGDVDANVTGRTVVVGADVDDDDCTDLITADNDDDAAAKRALRTNATFNQADHPCESETSDNEVIDDSQESDNIGDNEDDDDDNDFDRLNDPMKLEIDNIENSTPPTTSVCSQLDVNSKTPAWSRLINPVSQRKSLMKRPMASMENRPSKHPKLK